MIDNLPIFIFQKSQNTAFVFRDTPTLLGIAIVVARISIINFDYSKLNRVILAPLPMFYIRIVGLPEGYSWRLGCR
jgi:hypothetical protein